MKIHCKECSKEFERKQGEINKSPNHFCSRSCATIFNNRLKPKRSPEGCCKVCKTKIKTKSTYCQDCSIIFSANKIDWGNRTLGGEWAKRQYQKNSRIRTLARNKYLLSTKPQYCIKCGYDKHFEVCHIRAVSSFPQSAKITEINSLDNLIALCPNHHWEFDHGLFELDA